MHVRNKITSNFYQLVGRAKTGPIEYVRVGPKGFTRLGPSKPTIAESHRWAYNTPTNSFLNSNYIWGNVKDD